MKTSKTDDSALREVKVTTQPIGKSSSPRQPHERDESPDDQASGGVRSDMEQAARDVASGQVDTDLRNQPAQNPKNNAPATPSPKSTLTLPDGRKK